MKRILILFVALILSINSNAQNRANYDKHIAAGAFIGYATTLTMYNDNYKPQNAILVSAGIATLAGISKEALDKANGFKPDKYDVASTIAGGIIGSIVTNKLCRILFRDKRITTR